ncbi:MAG: radical SAM family heme chaperone HemW [Bdellovibrionales bacterium]|nr:radical SAM family heme chaperone HemW [Bdellovibrionales bacterium]
MSLAIYIHIPYCLQRCRYCDFTTFEQDQIMPFEKYIKLLCREIRSRHFVVPSHKVKSIYFGGGTPSILPASALKTLLRELRDVGFQWSSAAEITVEINPATVTPDKMMQYLEDGVNRFSVGAQTFSDELLKICGRRHTAQDTRNTLKLLHENRVNYSFDLLFALPGQTLKDLEDDLLEVQEYSPNHLSAYCLTVPETHPMAFGRAPEDEQVEMFRLIEQQLLFTGLHKYEISNFAKPGYESQHNLTYWNDQPYWGIGLSSHSYFLSPPFGVRFWNPKDFVNYEQQLNFYDEFNSALNEKRPFFFQENQIPKDQQEWLNQWESATDFCHMFMRTKKGLNLEDFQKKFGQALTCMLNERVGKLEQLSLVEKKDHLVSLTPEGELLSNQVFAKLHFFES